MSKNIGGTRLPLTCLTKWRLGTVLQQSKIKQYFVGNIPSEEVHPGLKLNGTINKKPNDPDEEFCIHRR